MTARRVRFVILSAALASGCTASKEAARGVEVAGPEERAPAASTGSSAAGGKASASGDNVPQISPRAKMLFEDGVKAAEASRRGKADLSSVERKFQAAAEADSSFGEADYNLGVLAERQGKRQEAIAHYKEALRKKPTLRQAAENLAVIAQNSGDEEGAVRIYENILENYPDDGSSRARLAEIYRRRGDHERAMQLAKEALYREPKTLPAYKVLMLSYYEQRQLSMAKLVALRAVKLDENDPEIYYTLGLINLAEKEPAKARLQLRSAIEKRPDYLPAHVVLAKMALEQDDFVNAEASLRRILQSDARNAEAHVNLGIAYKGMGQYDKAMAEYDAAQKLNPNLPAIYLNRGIVMAQGKGQPEKALELYRQYISLGGGGDAVHEMIRDSENVLAKREEDKRTREEAARMEAEMKQQQAAQDAEAKKVKQAELEEKMQAAKGEKGAAKTTADAKADAPKPEAVPARGTQKKAPPAPAPEGGAPTPSDEPSDEL